MSDSQTPEGGGGSGNKRTSKAPLGVVIPLPSRRELSDAHRAQLQTSGLSEETIALSAAYTETHDKRLAELMGWKRWNRAMGSALVFPFIMPGNPEPIGYRLKPDYPRKSKKGKPVKYDQREDQQMAVYYPPRTRDSGSLRNASLPVVWTEGEKKALALDQLGYVAVGLTGVWNWIDSAGRAEHGDRLHPLISEHTLISGRSHVICYDGDAREKDNVMQAAARLAGVLYAGGAVGVTFVIPPDVGTAKGIDDFLALHGAEATRALISTAQPLEPSDPKQPLARVRSLAALRDATLIPEALRLPSTYEVQKDGSLWCETFDDKKAVKVTHAPPFITRKLRDHYSGEERIDLAYANGDEGWASACVTRKAIADSRTLVNELAPVGGPVTSQNAGRVVEWLSEFEAVNTNAIERVECVGQTGWHTVGGARVFVTNEPILPTDSKAVIALDTRGERARMFRALKPKGDNIVAHVAALRRAWNADPIAAAVICGALAAPMLKMLGAPNFAIHLPGESSRGKTSMLKCAASVYGNPNDPAWLSSWDVSAAAAEIRAAVLNDLPQCYDEVGSADPALVERMIYSLINGGGRARATRDFLLREAHRWQTIILSTGERELVSEDAATGAQIRVVQLPVKGFGQLTAAEVDALRDECTAHAGVVGREWLAMLVGLTDEEWAEYRADLAAITAALRREARAGGLEGRVAAYFAVLSLAEAMAAEFFRDLGDPAGGTMKQLFLQSDERSRVRDQAERARELLEEFVLSEPESFPEVQALSLDKSGEPKRGTTPRHGFRRVGDIGGGVLVIKSSLDKLLAKHALNATVVLRQWAERGWILRGDGSHLLRRHSIGGMTERPRFVYLLPRGTDDEGQA